MEFYRLNSVRKCPLRINTRGADEGCSVMGGGFQIGARCGASRAYPVSVLGRMLFVPQPLTERKEFNAQKS